MVFLHGWEQNKEGWGQIVDILSKDFTCWAVDLPYFGQNNITLEDKTPLGYAEWVNAFLQENKITKAYILGHSFGGRIAIICANNNRNIKKVVLYGTPAFRSGNKNLTTRLMAKTRIRNVPLLSNMFRSSDYKNTTNVNREIFLKAVNFNLTPYIKKIKQPTLILWGQKDEEISVSVANKLNASIKNSALYVIPNGTHFVHIEKPLLFASVVKKFLKNEKSL